MIEYSKLIPVLDALERLGKHFNFRIKRVTIEEDKK
jgi:hypothetical protein